MISSRIFCFGLGAAAIISLCAVQPAMAGGTDYNYTVSFTTPTPFLSYNSGNIIFSFNPEGPGAPASSITGSNLTYSPGDWQVHPFPLPTFGVTSVDYFGGSITIGNEGAVNGFKLPVSEWGKTFGFDLNYIDPPGPTASDFSVTLQSGTVSDTLFDIQFNPNGQEILMSSAPGVSINAQQGTPDLGMPGAGTAPVPEASTTVSFGLLLALGLGAVAFRRKKTRSISTMD